MNNNENECDVELLEKRLSSVGGPEEFANFFWELNERWERFHKEMHKLFEKHTRNYEEGKAPSGIDLLSLAMVDHVTNTLGFAIKLLARLDRLASNNRHPHDHN